MSQPPETSRTVPRAAPRHEDLLGSAAEILGGSLAAVAAGLAVRVVMARSLSPGDLGALLLGIAVVSFVGGVASLGLRLASARRVSELLAAGRRGPAAATGRTAVTAAALSGGLAAALLAAASLPGSPLVGKLPVGLLAALAPVALGLAVGNALWGVSQGHGDSRGRALVRDTGGGLLRLTGVGGVALAGFGVRAMALGWAVGSAAGELAFLHYGRRGGWLRDPEGGRDRRLLRSLPPYAGNAVLSGAQSWLDMLLVGALAPLPVVGLYGLANSVFRVLGIVQSAAAHRFLPLATGAVTRGESEALEAAFRRARDLTFRLLWPALAPCLLCPAAVIGVAFGPEYAGAAGPLRLLAAGLLVPTLLGYTEELLVARDRPGLLLAFWVGSTALAAALLLLLVPRFGALGAAAATGSAVALRSAVSFGWLGRALRRAAGGRGALGVAVSALPATAAAAAAAVLGVPAWARLALVVVAAAPPALLLVRELLPRVNPGGGPPPGR